MKYSRNIALISLLIFSLLCSDNASAFWPFKRKNHPRRKARSEKVSSRKSINDIPGEIDWGTTTVLTDIKVRAYEGSDSLNNVTTPAAVEEMKTIAPAKPIETDLPSSKLSPMVQAILDEAKSHLGARYSYGSSGPKSFDCSGFTSYIFRQFDISLPHNSGAQNKEGTELQFMDEIRPGDLVFFRGRSVASSIGHVGIVTEVMNGGEDFLFIHASTSSGVIISRYAEDYYHIRYIGARRVIKED